MHHNILKPLEMKSSFYSVELDKYHSNVATGHLWNGKRLPQYYNYYPESAAAGLWTSPTDLAKCLIDYQKALLGKSQILSAESAREMMLPPLANSNAGLGLFVENHNGKTYLQHSGATRGFRSKLFFSTEGGNGVVIMHNGTDNRILDQVIRSVASVYGWEGFESFKVAERPSENELKKIAGTYRYARRVVKVSFDNGVLKAVEKKKWSSVLQPLSKTSFVVSKVQPRTTLEFVFDSKGNATKMIATQNGTGVVEWIKIE